MLTINSSDIAVWIIDFPWYSATDAYPGNCRSSACALMFSSAYFITHCFSARVKMSSIVMSAGETIFFSELKIHSHHHTYCQIWNRLNCQYWNSAFLFASAFWSQFHRQAQVIAISLQICGLSDLFPCYRCCRVFQRWHKNWLNHVHMHKNLVKALSSHHIYLKHGSFCINNPAPPSLFLIRILSMIQCKVSRLTLLSNSITM